MTWIVCLGEGMIELREVPEGPWAGPARLSGRLRDRPGRRSPGFRPTCDFARPAILPDLRFCPTGGITQESAPAYLATPNVLCAGGSWMVSRNNMAAKDFAGIRAAASDAARL